MSSRITFGAFDNCNLDGSSAICGFQKQCIHDDLEKLLLTYGGVSVINNKDFWPLRARRLSIIESHRT